MAPVIKSVPWAVSRLVSAFLLERKEQEGKGIIAEVEGWMEENIHVKHGRIIFNGRFAKIPISELDT